MKVLITGAAGQVGSELVRLGKARGYDLCAASHATLDITAAGQVEALIAAERPAVVVNAAAYTGVDKAETETQTALAVNTGGPRLLAQHCRQHGAALIHISTDYVFNGTQTRPYREDDPVAPIGVYGQSKLQGEVAVREVLAEHIIVRTAWVYGVVGGNFVKTMLSLGSKNRELRVVGDQIGCPTCAADLAAAIVTLLDRYKATGALDWGTYHFCGRGETSWHGFAEEIFNMARKTHPLVVANVVPIKTVDYPTPAKRPAYSVLDCSRIAKVFGITPRPWRDCLKETIATLAEQ